MRDTLKPPLTASLLAFAMLLLMPGCDSDSPTAPTLPEGNVQWEPLLQEETSGITMFRREVVRVETELRNLWDELETAIELPTVDFNVDMVVVVASGEQENGCYGIGVTAAVSDGTDLTVTVEETTPTTTCMCTAMMVQPVEVIKLPRANDVSFNNVTVATCST